MLGVAAVVAIAVLGGRKDTEEDIRAIVAQASLPAYSRSQELNKFI